MEDTFDFGAEVETHAPSVSDTAWFKPKEGDNRIRIVSTGAVIAEHFKVGVCYGKDKGCKTCAAGVGITDEEEKKKYQPSVKWMFWIIDRTDGQLKLYKIGAKIMKAISALQKNPDYSFSKIPAYDITVNVKNAGTKAAEYQLLPSPKITDLTEAEQAELGKKHSTLDIVAAMKKKQLVKEGGTPTDTASEEISHVDYPQEDINPDDIPF